MADLKMTGSPSWYARDDVLFPALLLLVGPPPEKGLRLRPGTSLTASPSVRYTCTTGAGRKYKRDVDGILGPMAHEVFAAHKYNSRCKKGCQRRNEFIIWILGQKA